MTLRSPICTVMGHVDHGKSSLLDYIRSSNIVAREAGAITQAIGASIVPIATLREICGKCLKDLKAESFTIPGLLFIDTPGHAAFTNLRKRGGNLADIAVLVVDINEGFMPQTIEAMQILRQYKTPFIIAANKIDLIAGFKSQPEKSVLKHINELPKESLQKIETKIYEMVGKTYELGFQCERFDRVQDYTKEIAIVPISAKFGDGVPELLMLVVGLAQKFLEKGLQFDLESPARGTVLEVKDEQGIGVSLDVIIYDGVIKTGDTFVVGTTSGEIVSKVRCLFEPAPKTEMRDKKSKFAPVKKVFAATGVKVSGPGLEGAQAGMPFMVAKDEAHIVEVKKKLRSEIEEVVFELDEEGIIAKADSLGSLEALVRILKEQGLKVRKSGVGNITRKDIVDAEANEKEEDKIVIGFNVSSIESPVKVITSDVIYSLIDQYKEWRTQKEKEKELEKVSGLTAPAKIEFLLNHTFRKNNPAIIGVEVIGGTLQSGVKLMNREGIEIGTVRAIQKDNKGVTTAKKGDQVAVSIEGPTVGRQIAEEDLFFSMIIESEFLKYKEVKDILAGDEKAVLKEIADIMRKANPVWGV